jgi:integrase
MNINYSKDNTHVEDSYKVKDIDIEVMQIIRERQYRGLPISRTFDSYVREWKGHNRLYKLHLFRSHTKDVDLEEPSKWYLEIVWLIIGR